MKNSLLFIALIVWATILQGCVISEKIKGTDESVYFPSFRLSYNSSPPQEKIHSFGFEVNASQGSGESSQRLGSWDDIRLGNTDFNGPTIVNSKFEISTLSAAVKWGIWIREKVGFEWMGGVGLTAVDLELTSAGLYEHENFLTLSPFTGTQITLRPLSYLSIYGRGGLSYWGPTESLFSRELGVNLSLTPSFSVFGGWRKQEYTDEMSSPKSDISLMMAGPMAGLLLTF